MIAPLLLISLLPFCSAMCLPCKQPHLSPRDVFVPPIESPTEGDIWLIASEQTVTWSIDDIPEHVTNPTGKLVLGKLNGDQEHLYTDIALAEGFPITDKNVTIIVPKVDPADNYIVVLFGDSGNRSPPFTITHE